MAEKKLRVVHFLNQFFGQIGGEEEATTGFVVKEGPVGPGLAFQKELGDRGEIIATLICGDDYFSRDADKNAEEGLKLLMSYQPTLFFAGPSFAGGRYGISCGAMCKAIIEALNIPSITAMYEENPGVDLYRKYAYICKAPNIARGMPDVVRDMVRLAIRLVSGEREMRLVARENLPKPEEYNYFSRNLLRNEYCAKSIAERSVDNILAKIKGEPFETEVICEVFEKVPPPPPVIDLSKCEIALISDGGLVPKGNPDRLSTRSNLKWGAYDIESLFHDYELSHAGYLNDHVLERPDRLVPFDIMRELEKEGKIGKLHRTFFSTSGNCTVSQRCGEMGEEIGIELQKRGVKTALITST
jgi:betaine reductase